MSQWLVLRVRPSRELKAEKDLRAVGIATMAPYLDVWAFNRMRHNRPRKRRHALFPGYAFVCLPDIGAGWQAIQATLNTDEDRIAIRLLPNSNNPALLGPEDVSYLASIADGKYQPEDDAPRPLQVGDEVLIPGGPLKGLIGTILRIKGGRKATVAVKRVKMTSRLEIPIANLDRL